MPTNKTEKLFQKALAAARTPRGRAVVFGHSRSQSQRADHLDKEIIKGMARAVFVDQWQVRQEEHRVKQSYEQYLLLGMNINEHAPKTPSRARAWAKDNAKQILALSPGFKTLTEMFEYVVSARGYNRNQSGPRSASWPETFGSDLGLQSVGYGTGWEDRVDADYPETLQETITVPHNEFYL